MTSDGSRRGLRRSIDESAEAIGERAAAEIPESPLEVRRRLPDSPLEDLRGDDGDGQPIRAALSDTPIGELLERTDREGGRE